MIYFVVFMSAPIQNDIFDTITAIAINSIGILSLVKFYENPTRNNLYFFVFACAISIVFVYIKIYHL